jgi:predicted metal-dependent HD superfamily phosphohydrolase
MLHRWLEFAASIAPQGDARTLWIMLEALYSGGVRPYHSLAHIEECLARLDAWRGFVRCQPELEFALWLHDAVYQPGSAANEGGLRTPHSERHPASAGKSEQQRMRVSIWGVGTRAASSPKNAPR